jgi:hypothetical protein
VKPIADHAWVASPDVVARLCAAFWAEYDEALFVSFDSSGEVWLFVERAEDVPSDIDAFYQFVVGFLRGAGVRQ